MYPLEIFGWSPPPLGTFLDTVKINNKKYEMSEYY